MSLYRIGTASRRSGLSIATLRNWELRYGLVTPIRTPGGQRLYSDDNIERLRALKVLVDQGLSAGEANNVLRGRLRAPARPREPAPRAASAGDARAQARRLRAEVADTHEDAAAQYDRAVEHFTALAAATTTGSTADRFRELAERARAHAARKRALAAGSRARSTQPGE